MQTADPLPDGRVRIHYDPQHNPAEALVQQSVSQQWGLYELIPERMSLEQIFVDITHTESTPDEQTQDQTGVAA